MGVARGTVNRFGKTVMKVVEWEGAVVGTAKMVLDSVCVVRYNLTVFELSMQEV